MSRRAPHKKEAPEPKGLPRKPTFDLQAPAHLPLSEEEKNELAQHFSFIAKNRNILRLSFNAAENLLVNGARKPEDRGVCMHLLGKIDRSTITSALSRLPDAESKTRLLAGIVRFSRDVAVLVQYLEALSSSAPRDEAAATLAQALRQVDYRDISAAQMRRLLQLVVTVLPKAERPNLLLNLLRGHGFRDAFDQASDVMPEELAELLLPIRAAWGHLFDERHAQTSLEPQLIERGVALLLDTPPKRLASWPEEARARIVEAGLGLEPEPASLEPIAHALLADLDKRSRTFSRIALARARKLLRRGDDEAARTLLEEIRRHHPNFELPRRWLDALAAPRLGRFALYGARKNDPIRPGLQRAFDLTAQRPVLLLVDAPSSATGDRPAAASAEALAELHRRLVLPGVVPLLESRAVDGHGAVRLLLPMGEPAAAALRSVGRAPAVVHACLRSAIEILAALGERGVQLPDAALDRFVIEADGRLSLADLSGCAASEPAATKVAHLHLAKGLCETLLDGLAGPRAYGALREGLGDAQDLVAMHRLSLGDD